MPKDTKVIIVDDSWTNKIQYDFNSMLCKLGLSIGEDYIYSSMLYSKIDTNEVIELMIKGYSCEEIVSRIASDDYFNIDDLNRNIESELDKFKEREESLDIKMCDYLKDNYSKYCLFATANHPTREILLEFSRRILTQLGITDMNILCEDDEIQAPMAKNLYFVIYPSVLKALGLPERRYILHVKFRGCELAVLKGIDDELDQFINEKMNDRQELFEIKIVLTFEKYMTVYVRMLQSMLHI